MPAWWDCQARLVGTKSGKPIGRGQDRSPEGGRDPRGAGTQLFFEVDICAGASCFFRSSAAICLAVAASANASMAAI